MNYQAVGSFSGRKAFIDEIVNFGASGDPMTASDIAKVTCGIVQTPMFVCTIALDITMIAILNLLKSKLFVLLWVKLQTGMRLVAMLEN